MSVPTEESGLCLGIDLGTSSVKVNLVDRSSNTSIFSTSEPTKADINTTASSVKSEQSPRKILKCVCDCLTRITDKNRSLVQCIVVTGQMHGVMLWNSESRVDLSEEYVLDASNLITWQDRRATDAFIEHLPAPDSHQCLSAGFGCVSLFWLSKCEPEAIVKYNAVGSIMDYFVTVICGLDRPVMSNQIASSWGYFNTETNNWNTEILKEAGFPVHLLPMVTRAGNQVGELCSSFFGIPKSTPVLAGMGDLQCSFKSAVQSSTDAVMNVSTSCQLSYAIRCSGFVPPRFNKPTAISYCPYINNTYLAVAASLNGGNTLGCFINMLQTWFSEFGLSMEEEKIWETLTNLAGLRESASSSGLVAIPLLYGERHMPHQTASLSGINGGNMQLGTVFRSLLEGIINNIHSMMPGSLLIESGITKLIVNGSVVERQPYMMGHIRKVFNVMEVEEGAGTDAALGAALFACKFLNKPNKDTHS